MNTINTVRIWGLFLVLKMRLALVGIYFVSSLISYLNASDTANVKAVERSFQAAVGFETQAIYGGALAEVDLASDTAWTMSTDGGPTRPIKVPGGGWNSDSQTPRIDTMTGVSDHVIYERKLEIPQLSADQVTRISFGAVNYGAEIYIDDKLVGSHDGSQTPFEVDLTGAVTPGKCCDLKVKAIHRRHYMIPTNSQPLELSPFFSSLAKKKKDLLVCTVPVSIDTPVGAKNWVTCGWFGHDKFSYGIIRYVKLRVYPAVHIDDLFVKPSVSNNTLTVIASVRNTTGGDKSLILSGRLESWNKQDWPYPSIPETRLEVPAGKSRQVVIGPIRWGLGPKSYWWPNIPFREEYIATLHNLILEIRGEEMNFGKPHQTYTQRFGFCEHAEGPYYYTVNGVRVMQVGDVTTESQIGAYDAYATLPAFLPPTKPGTGCPETWRRYMRCGINANRVSCNLPTKYMLETADEVGFMLIPEAVEFGNFSSIPGPVHAQTVREMGWLCRNHPSVIRYSLGNEIRGSMEPWCFLIDAMREVDDSRPLIFDNQGKAGNMFVGIKGGHAYDSQHYGPAACNVKKDKIFNMGEMCWGTDLLMEFGVEAMQLRLFDWGYLASWCWLNYWPNFFEGMNSQLHVQKMHNSIDRVDNVNGWGSPVVALVQRALHPYLVVDTGILKENLPSYRMGINGPTAWHQLGQGDVQWPRVFPKCSAGETVTRQIEIFNGGLEGDQLSLRWSGRWDSPNGPVAVAGETVGPLTIQSGFHATQAISFTVPAIEAEGRRLYVVLESLKEGAVVYREDRIYLDISRGGPQPSLK